MIGAQACSSTMADANLIESRWPHFMIIGAAKAGTTTLYEYVSRHPHVFMPKVKEPEYFSGSQLIERKGWYHSLFTQAREGQMKGEASTDYTRWPHTADVPQRIHKWIPGAKFIYVMRHPVERSYSHYAHDMRKGVTMTFEEALEASDLYIDSSMYMFQIERYLRYFARESLLFITSDELYSDPREVVRRVQEFLGLEVRELVKEALLQANEGGARKTVDHFVRFRVRSLLGRFGLLTIADRMPTRMRPHVFRMFRHSPVGIKIAASYNLPMMKPETRARLLQLFEEPNRALAAFLGRDLSNWNR